MKLRKVLSLIIAIAMIMTASTAFAFSDVDVENDAYEAITALSALNILTGYEDGTFLPEGKVTRAEFATIIMRAKGYDVKTTTNTIFDDVKADHWASGAIAEAFGAAIVNGRVLNYDANGNVIGGTFDPEAEVTYEEAVKMIVCALGYQQMAESMVKPGVNPYPTAYNLIANQRGITADVAKTAGGASRATIARLVWNALPVGLFEQYSWGSDNNFSEDQTKSLLLNSLDAVLLEEAKLAGSNNLLDPKDVDIELTGVKVDEVSANAGIPGQVNLTSVKLGACDVKALQGLTVKALVSIEDKYNPTLLAVFPSGSNRTLEVNPALFVQIDTNNKIEYYPNSSANITNTSSAVQYDTANSRVDVDVYTNGHYVGNGSTAITNAASMSRNPNNKVLRFVDTDNNGYYDTLFVDNSASFVVGAVDTEEYTIMADSSSSIFNSDATYDDMTSTGIDYDFELVLDPEDDTVTWDMADETGKELEVSDVNVGDVITYAMTTDGTFYYYDITVCKATAVTGTVGGTSTDKRTGKTLYNIDGTKYMLNNEYAGSLEIGATGTFQLTADGKIISCQLDKSVRNFVAGIKVAAENSGFGGSVSMQLMDAEGAVSEVAFADDFYVNDVKFTTKTSVVNGQTVITDITDGTNDITIATFSTALQGQPLMVEYNASGAIRKLYTKADIDATATAYSAVDGIKAKDDDYSVVTFSGQYSASSEKVGSTYFVESSAILANESVSASNDKKDYSLIAKDAFVDEKSYSGVAVVDIDKNVVLAVVNGFIVLPSYSSAPMYVTSIGYVNVEGEQRRAITGLVNGEEVTYNMAADEDVKFAAMGDFSGNTTTDSKGIAVNDVIQFTLNGASEINAYRYLVSVASGQATFLVSANAATADADNKETATSNMKAVTIALDGSETRFNNLLATTTSSNGHDATIATSAQTGAGYGAFGRIQRVNGRTVGIFNTISLTATGSAPNIVYTNNDQDYFDVVGATDLPVYVYTSSLLDDYETKALGGLKTYKSRQNNFDKSDDVIYIFRYDGETVFQYAIDIKGDNN